jgi:hypothetical protein
VAERTRTWLRRAGRARLGDGSELLWSLAEGGRGRRWRAVTTLDGRMTHALLLEVDRSGRPARLELTTEAGMLTLHPEPDGRSIHGNVVHRGGVRPLAHAWSPDHDLEIVDRPLATAVMLRRLSSTVRVGAGETVPVLAIDGSLAVRPGSRLVRRLADRQWIVADLAGAREISIELDTHGIPQLGSTADDWPLEA